MWIQCPGGELRAPAINQSDVNTSKEILAPDRGTLEGVTKENIVSPQIKQQPCRLKRERVESRLRRRPVRSRNATRQRIGAREIMTYVQPLDDGDAAGAGGARGPPAPFVSGNQEAFVARPARRPPPPRPTIVREGDHFYAPFERCSRTITEIR
ncbi:hypothetical protein EVAR_15651_1 [Eumeta japonica]|uniref:Uncharacterized protein n=1 Tax=Eumeta variegata TaxID=151549 RepID=A0A4C1UA85_EUMVA|nr:hypothetical protein EVAR_15651_1 [Eumeta japonica]